MKWVAEPGAPVEKPRPARRPDGRRGRFRDLLLGGLLLLTACNGSVPPPTPDYGTPAAETPGPVLATEEQYIAQVAQYESTLFNPRFPFNRLYFVARGNPRGPGWEERLREELQQMYTLLGTAETLQPPPRLRGIHEHYQAALAQYRQALVLNEGLLTDYLVTPTPRSIRRKHMPMRR